MITHNIKAGRGDFKRGIHPPAQKQLSKDNPVVPLPLPQKVSVPVLQHTGAPCDSKVKPRQKVTLGELLGESTAFISAPIHAPVKGTVAMPAMTTLPNGRHMACIPIQSDSDSPDPKHVWDDLISFSWPKAGLDSYEAVTIVEDVKKAGIVGLGGAAFPTHVKLTWNEKKPVDVLLINGCECEPYLTNDDRLMMEASSSIVTGALLAARAVKVKTIMVAIEDNKPESIRKMRETADGTGIQIIPVHTKYPMGGERQVVPAVLGREVPTGGLPLDVGVVVINVGTASSIACAVIKKQPLTHRVITVTGRGVKQPNNLFVPIGISYKEAIDFCGGLTQDAKRVISGGPMMGFTIGDLETPITKGTSGVVVLTEQDLKDSDELNCIRCGRCVDVCPLNLVPTKIALSSKYRDWSQAKRHHLMACCECGCCAYICPSQIPLVQLIRLGKSLLPKEEKKGSLP
ncbi:MAG: electron transport complex subunit RsxC [Candidatus Aureabacteria bacterium]|nr:electron transport complex subunit RsxC [Candidatus Auribacterota bacterium]